MRKFNVLFDEKVEPFLKDDIHKCVCIKMGYFNSHSADITYKVAQDLRIYKKTSLTDYTEISTQNLLWDNFIPYLPKEEHTCLVSSSNEFFDQTLSLSNKTGFYYHKIESYPSLCYDNYCVIGDHNLDMIPYDEKNVIIYTIDLTMKYGYENFNNIYTMNINNKHRHKNVNLIDTTSILVDIIYNNFYRIGG